MLVRINITSFMTLPVTAQIFVLDSRQHGTRTLYDPKLAETQGPALLAFNDALFSDEDWEALQSIHRSSKKDDTS